MYPMFRIVYKLQYS